MYRGKPVIAVMPLYDDERDSYWMLPGYMKCLEEQGAVPVMLPLCDAEDELAYFIDTCDGFLLTGGHDVSPELYGEAILPVCGAISRLRDSMDKYILENAVEEDKAVLGICRGIQIMNAVYGGTLYQDLPSQQPSGIEHHMEPPYDRHVHAVSIREDSPLYRILQTGELYVNSYHHQAVKALSPSFQPMAAAPDGIIEGIYMPDKNFVWGVQWHPELSYLSDEASRQIAGAFLDAVRKKSMYYML